MDFGEWINMLPLWAVFVLTLVICVGAVEAGTVLARIALRHRKEKEPEGPLGSFVGSLLGRASCRFVVLLGANPILEVVVHQEAVQVD